MVLSCRSGAPEHVRLSTSPSSAMAAPLPLLMGVDLSSALPPFQTVRLAQPALQVFYFVRSSPLFQVLLSFPWSTRARGLSRSARVCEEVFKFSPLAEKRGSLEGVRERGFKQGKAKKAF